MGDVPVGVRAGENDTDPPVQKTVLRKERGMGPRTRASWAGMSAAHCTPARYMGTERGNYCIPCPHFRPHRPGSKYKHSFKHDSETSSPFVSPV